jgi:hypothetical protein
MNDTEKREDLEKMKKDLEKIKDHYNMLPNTKEVQTIPLLLDKQYNENFISDLLGFILNPNINGIGLEPLRNIINEVFKEDFKKDGINRASKFIEETTLNEYEICVVREYNDFNKSDKYELKGSMDIVITFRCREDNDKDRSEDKEGLEDSDVRIVIGIENKVGAKEGKGQTEKYKVLLENKFPNVERYLLFLSKEGTEPDCRDFIAVKYETIVNCLKSIRYDFAKDIRKSILFNEFITHVEEYIMNEPLEIKEETRLYLENHKMIDLIKDTFAADRKRLLDYLANKILDELNRNLRKKDWELSAKGGNDYRHITKEGWDNDEKTRAYFVPRITPDTLSNGTFTFEIYFWPKKGSDISKIRDNFKKELPEEFKNDIGNKTNCFFLKEYQILKDKKEFDQEYFGMQISEIVKACKKLEEAIDAVLEMKKK